MKKRAAPKINIIPFVFFVISAIVLSYYSVFDPYTAIFKQISWIAIYFAFSLGCILIFEFLKNRAKRKPKEKKKKIKNVVQTEEIISDEETEEKKKPKLLKIFKKKNKKKDITNRGLKWVNIGYIVMQTLITAAFIFNVFFSFSINTRKEEMAYSFIHVVVLLVFSLVAFVVKKWICSIENKRCIQTFISYLSVFAFVCVISAIFIVISVMFGLEFFAVLYWILRISIIYTGIMILFGILISVIKHQPTEDFNYIVPVPLMNASSKDDFNFINALEENTGLSVKSLWSFRYISKIFPGVILAVFVLLFVSTSVYKIEPYQQGALYRFGTLTSTAIKEAGFHFKLPWPIDKVEIYDVERVKTVQVGYDSANSTDYLWTLSHDGGEHKLLLGNGNELVSVNIKLAYYIDDLYSYISVASNPESILTAKTYEVMMDKTITTDLDTFLTVDREDLSEKVKSELNQFCDTNGLGIQINQVIIESIHPPVEIAGVYQNVVNAGIQKTTKITEAETTALETMTLAEKESETAIIDAKANQSKRVAEATYEMAVYNAAFEAYQKDPESFKLTKYLDTYEKIIGGNKVYVFSPNVDSDLSKYLIGYGSSPSKEEETLDMMKELSLEDE